MLKETEIRNNSKYHDLLCYLNSTNARKNNNYFMIITNMLNGEKFPLFCKKEELKNILSNLGENKQRLDIIIELENNPTTNSTINLEK